jgi:hypothetical protein
VAGIPVVDQEAVAEVSLSIETESAEKPLTVDLPVKPVVGKPEPVKVIVLPEDSAAVTTMSSL